MARNPVLQISCEPNLYDKICTYKEQKRHTTDAAAVRESIEFTLKAIEFSEHKDGVSNRDILEKIFSLVAESNLLNQHTFYNSAWYPKNCGNSDKEVINNPEAKERMDIN